VVTFPQRGVTEEGGVSDDRRSADFAAIAAIVYGDRIASPLGTSRRRRPVRLAGGHGLASFEPWRSVVIGSRGA